MALVRGHSSTEVDMVIEDNVTGSLRHRGGSNATSCGVLMVMHLW